MADTTDTTTTTPVLGTLTFYRPVDDTDRWTLEVEVGGTAFEVGRYPDVSSIAAAARKWTADRGLAWAGDSKSRLDAAQRTMAWKVTFDLVKRATC